MRLKIDQAKCNACLVCELECSRTNEGIVQPKASAIRVKFLEQSGKQHHEPVVCRQCAKMLCLKGEGLDYDAEEAGKFHWENPDRVKDCPFHALFIFKGKIIHCHLCSGAPRCVEMCPTGALTIEE